ncbi:hypothetical protein V8C37DRAFT_391799 [Trichoderma ceciliae]
MGLFMTDCLDDMGMVLMGKTHFITSSFYGLVCKDGTNGMTAVKLLGRARCWSCMGGVCVSLFCSTFFPIFFFQFFFLTLDVWISPSQRDTPQSIDDTWLFLCNILR